MLINNYKKPTLWDTKLKFLQTELWEKSKVRDIK